MKVRADFVTNSSSASFVLAFKDEKLTQRQKEAIVEDVLKNALGHKMSEKDWKDFDRWYDEEDWYEEAKEYQAKEGWTVRSGSVDFEDAGYHYSALLEGLWHAVAKADPEHTKLINTDLSY